MKKRLKKKLYTDCFYDDFRYICMEKHPPKFRINTISRMRENYGLAKYERRTVDYSPQELRNVIRRTDWQEIQEEKKSENIIR